MSDTDSFIDEVTEEVRRDRLFLMLRRYGWIGAVVVVAIVGGTALREINRSKVETASQALGDSMIAAVDAENADARAAALAAVETETLDRQMVLDMARAGALVDAGNTDEAVVLLQSIGSNGDLPEIYRHIASFKSLILQSESLGIEERRLQFDALAAPNAPLRHLAQEQLALLDIEAGDTSAAIARLQALVADATSRHEMRDRANQLIVALGGEVAPQPAHGG
ncbi:hypothetical protein GG681_16695 [Epibacterium sp. SM1969]|uniref:Tetratricopeptide repeat-like domain-containing protein n=1 Tax=Tritonibacter aquimaris TaxID=2663379 RepID=A0A844AWM0_9RHOB|nr:hypothetical protein [Tritonibacter aquimaris]MQY44287.1 hypothetical protein [Tritonibacter aquimaris]